MTFSRVEGGHARILILAMKHDFPSKMVEWEEHLKVGRMTREMREVFAAMGYPVPRMRAEKRAASDVDDRPTSQLNSAEDMQMVADEAALHDMHASDGGGSYVRFAHGSEDIRDYEPGLLDELPK